MKRRNQMLGILLAVAMVSTLFTGCGQKQEGKEVSEHSSAESSQQEVTEETQAGQETTDSYRIFEEPVTITVLGGATNSDNDWNSTVQFQQYEEQLGIKLEATTYASSDELKSKLSLLLASDELPDILANVGLTPDQRAEYGADGYLLDFSEYLDIMPNLSAYMEKYPDYAACLKDDEGHIYGLSQINESADMYRVLCTWINQKWLDNLGLEKPKTLDELYDVLVAFRDEDANGNGDPDDEIPMGYQGDTWFQTEYIILWAHGIDVATTDGQYHRMIGENNQVVLGNTTENYKDFLKYMNKLYSEKLINQDCYVVNKDELLADLSEQKVGMMMSTRALPPDDDPIERVKTWSIVGGLTDEKYSSENKIVLYGRTSANSMMAISANTKYPEELCKFFDYLYTDEGILSTTGGFEGITCDAEDFFGYTIYSSEAYEDKFGDNFLAATTAINGFMLVSTTKFNEMGALESLSMEELTSDECAEVAGVNSLKEINIREHEGNIIEGYPNVIFTNEESEEMSTLKTDIQSYMKTMKAQFITGELDIDANWDAYLAELDKMGLDRLLEIEQAALDRYLAKQ